MPRPVTPAAIIADALAGLSGQAAQQQIGDPAFRAHLAETAALAGGLDAYLARSTTPPSDTLAGLAAETAAHDWDGLHAAGDTAVALEQEMVSGHVEGQLLRMLVQATGATRVLEIGLFTGYSALAMAEALPDGGRLVACEIDPYAASVAQRWFDRTPHGRKIRVVLGPAIGSLAVLRDAGEQFDFVFIDADKGGYAAYFAAIVGSDLLAPGGMLCVDNTLMQGQPYAQGDRSTNGAAIAAFNRLVADDPRVEQVLLPIRDGLTLIRRVLS